uniref:Large ribosomal subunit protein bL9 n=2 Tax=Candidatus Bipolaricaulota TaxID=67810 RepID=H5S932_9BACT|nr:50S ribosomal protein L9 [uncultured Acetothermia bacterium]BAL59277.1 50S ribosomal protein L9 [Candidatus Acetothermum autotrophicum]
MIEVLLTQSVEKLGEPGDIVKVADGYARNYLFPRKLAVLPTPHNIAQYKKLREKRELELKQREEWARAAQAKLDGFTLTFQRKAHDGKLYSSVRREEIAQQISEKLGIEIPKDKIELDTPIEALGVHTVKISLYKDITASIRVHVEEEPSAG